MIAMIKRDFETAKAEDNKKEEKNNLKDFNSQNKKTLWEEIHELAVNKIILLNKFKLRCQMHKNNTEIKTAKDFR